MTATKTIYLLRHCLTANNELGITESRADNPLSEKGKAQAASLVTLLDEYSFDCIIVSPLKRTLETIIPYLESLDKKPTVYTDPLIIERNLGKFTNVEKDNEGLKIHRSASTSRVAWIPTDGESLISVTERANIFFEKLKQRNEEKILVVSHRNFLRSLELTILNKPCDDTHYYNNNPGLLKNGELRMYII